jgi:hypothetical protein
MKPTKEKVFIKKLGKELILDFFTISDDNWMMDKYGQEKLQKALTEFEPDIVLDLFWRVMDDDSKRIIAKLRLVEWDGLEEKELKIDDPIERLKRVVSGADELFNIWAAILAVKKKSMPELDENIKKKVMGENH